MHAGPLPDSGENRRHRSHPRPTHRRLRPGPRGQARRRTGVARARRNHAQHPDLSDLRRNGAHDFAQRLHATPPFHPAAGRDRGRVIVYLRGAGVTDPVRTPARCRSGGGGVAGDVRLLSAGSALLSPRLVRRPVVALGGAILRGSHGALRRLLLERRRGTLERPRAGFRLRLFRLRVGHDVNGGEQARRRGKTPCAFRPKPLAHAGGSACAFDRAATVSAYRLEFLLPLAEYFSIRGSSPVLADTRLLSEKNRNSHRPIWFCRSLWPLSPLCSLLLTLIFRFLKTLCLCASVVNSCFLFGSGYAGLGSGCAPFGPNVQLILPRLLKQNAARFSECRPFCIICG